MKIKSANMPITCGKLKAGRMDKPLAIGAKLVATSTNRNTHTIKPANENNCSGPTPPRVQAPCPIMNTRISHIHQPQIRVGISGWRYTPWRDHFYPKGLRQKDELHFASRAVNTIEINGSFYGLQTPQRYRNWYADTPDDFVFSVKAPRYVTHIKRLRDVEIPIANFFASGPLQLKDKLGPILWQFPPSFKFNPDLFEKFLNLLPKDRLAAHACAANHSEEVKEADDEKPQKLPLRHCVEIRNESFRHPDFIQLLREHKVALVVADTAGRWPQLEDITADFIYMRLHGDTELYNSGYSDAALERWYQRMYRWSQGSQPDDPKLVSDKAPPTRDNRDIYCYFDNTDKLWAPQDARKILTKFGLADDLQAQPGQLPEGYRPTRRQA
jgi:uncharacterized protein YecE (DUF72 family)